MAENPALLEVAVPESPVRLLTAAEVEVAFHPVKEVEGLPSSFSFSLSGTGQ